MTLSDLSAREEIEAELRWNEQRFKDFSEAAGDWFWESDTEHRMVYLSQRFEEITGLPASRFLGRRRTDVAGADLSDPAWLEHVATLKAHRPFRDFVYWVEDQQGRRRHFRINGIPIFDADGGFRGFRGTGLEITERVEAQARLLAAERRLSEAMEQIPDGYALYDADDRMVQCNRTWRERLNPGIADVLIIGSTFEQGLRENVRRGHIAEALHDEEAWIQERLARHRSATGEPFEVERGDGVWNMIREHRTRDGATIIVSTDISELKQRERALIESEARFRDYAETAADWFWETDAEHRVKYVSDRYESTTGISRDAVLGRALREQASALNVEPDQIAPMLERMEAREPFDSIEFEIHAPTGETRIHALSGRALIAGDATFLGYRGSGRDVTRARRLSREIAYQASHDSLTGLVNRREFESRLERVIDTAHALGSEHVLSYLDLDQFKVINDTCGHFAGDELLRRLAALLQARVRQRDTLARLGGDEFGVLMEHCGLPQARLVADDLRQTVERFRFQWEGKTFAVGASIGLVAITGDLADLGEAMRAADSACYVAKDQGRNRIHVYDPDDEELARRHGEMQWVSRIGDALENARLCLACQLIAPVRQPSRGGLRYEILLRMEDDEGGLVLPGAFLPAAERYGLASRLDRWVVQHTLEQLARHPAHVERLESCAINLSGQSLGDPDFLTAIAQMLDRSGISPEKICFEITETAAIADVANAVEFMRALEQRGCRFALDDFGSGLSSFGYLKTLPVHFLKIDGTFVRGLAGDSVDAAMVRSINDIGHAMGKQTIAEYVEDGEILAKLASIGVDYAQGYHVARPMPLQRLLDESAPASGFT